MAPGKYFFGCILAVQSCSGLVDGSFDALASGFAARFGVTEVHATALEAFAPDLIVDVRTPAEQSVSTLPGAVLMSPDQDLASLPQFANARRILVYCAGGYRSARAIAALPGGAGGRIVRNLHGGIVAYANEGLPLVTPVGTPTRKVHGYNEAWVKYVQPPAEGVVKPDLE